MKITKRCSRKRKRAKQNMPSDDSRLSALPDDILCRILSLAFPRTKCHVATSVLSRRWIFLWTRVPYLNFDVEHYTEKLGADDIQKVLSMNDVQSLDTFRLSYRTNFNYREFETLITAICAHNIKHFYLNFDDEFYEMLPPCLFKCKSLVDLGLSCCKGIPNTLSLPNLKTLHLHSVRFEYDQSPNLYILSGCSVLEELNIINCDTGCMINCVNLHISSSTLKSLRVSHNRREYNKVVINAPALTSLYVFASEKISFVELKSLIEADISLCFPGYIFPFDKDKEDKFYIYLVNVLDSLCNVKCLRLSVDYVQFNDITLAESTCIMSSSVSFANLTKLNLESHGLFLRTFLEACNNLEVLIYQEVYKGDEDDQNYWMDPQLLPACLTSSIKSITINWFRCKYVHEFAMIRYLLKNAKVLKKMEINCYRGWKEQLYGLQIISRFPRGSEACELDFGEVV